MGFIIEAGLDQREQDLGDKLMLIKRIMIDLEYVWTQNADLRLGQLIESLYGCGVCMYHRDDQTIADAVGDARLNGLVISDVGTDDDPGMV